MSELTLAEALKLLGAPKRDKRRGSRRSANERPASSAFGDRSQGRPMGAIPSGVEAIARHEQILDHFADDLKRCGVAGEERAAKLLYLALTSRIFDSPVSVIVKGPSSAGKSHLTKNVLRFFPSDSFSSFSATSPRALIYRSETLKHRFLYVYEAAAVRSGLGAYLLRTLLSEGRLQYETVVNTPDGPRSKAISREGPTGVVLTTTLPKLDEELETRLFSVPISDDKTQTRNVLRAIARGADDQFDHQHWHAFQEWLAGEDHRVSIPYRDPLGELTQCGGLRIRRDLGAGLTLIKSHAVLHQLNRDRDDDGRIVANLDDYRTVWGLVADLVSEGVEASVPPMVRETVVYAAVTN